MCDNCVVCNATCTNAIQCERYSFWNVFKTIKINENFISQYFLFSTSIQRNVYVIEMRSITFIVSLNYIYIMCWKTLIATIAESHYIKEIVLMFLKTRFENLAIFFFENSNRLSQFIHWSKILSIFRTIIRSINKFIIKNFYERCRNNRIFVS